jgi:hypothetical protein
VKEIAMVAVEEKVAKVVTAEIVAKVQDLVILVQDAKVAEVAMAIEADEMVDNVRKAHRAEKAVSTEIAHLQAEVDRDHSENHSIKNLKLIRISCSFYGNKKHRNYCTR